MAEPEYKRWYKTARWQRRRAAQIAAEPLCAMCAKRDGSIVEATVADHVEPHRGDYDLFWFGELQSTCARCHNSDKQRIEKGGKARPTTGDDGWPIEGPGGR